MNKLYYILFILLVSCIQNSKEKASSSTLEQNKNTVNKNGNKEFTIKNAFYVWPEEVLIKCNQNYDNYKFRNLKRYSIDSNYCKEENGLIPIDSITLRKIHNFKHLNLNFSWGFNRDLKTSFFYSIDSCINDLYPITILVFEKFCLQALWIYLFDHEGKIVNSYKVAWRGEEYRGIINLKDDPIKAGQEIPSDRLSNPFCTLKYSERINDTLFIHTKISIDPYSITSKSDWINKYESKKFWLNKSLIFCESNIKKWRSLNDIE